MVNEDYKFLHACVDTKKQLIVRNDELEKDLKEASERIEFLEESLDCRWTPSELFGKLVEESKNNYSLGESLHKCQQELLSLIEDSITLEEINEDKESEIFELKSENIRLRDKIDDLTSEIEDWVGESELWEIKSADMELNHEAELEDLREQYEDMLGKKMTGDAYTQDLLKRKKKSDEKVTELEKELDNVRSSCAQYRSKADWAYKRIDELEEYLKDYIHSLFNPPVREFKGTIKHEEVETDESETNSNESKTPSHYDAQVDVVDFCTMHFGEDSMKYVHLFNIIKYATRFGKKDDELKEVNKIIHYAEMLKELVE